MVGPVTWTRRRDRRARGRPAGRRTTRGSRRDAGRMAFARDGKPVIVRGPRVRARSGADERGAGRKARLVVDLTVNVPQSIGVALRAHGAAVMRVGGHVVIDRAYVARAATRRRGSRGSRFRRRGPCASWCAWGMDDDGEPVEIGAWDEHRGNRWRCTRRTSAKTASVIVTRSSHARSVAGGEERRGASGLGPGRARRRGATGRGGSDGGARGASRRVARAAARVRARGRTGRRPRRGSPLRARARGVRARPRSVARRVGSDRGARGAGGRETRPDRGAHLDAARSRRPPRQEQDDRQRGGARCVRGGRRRARSPVRSRGNTLRSP